MLVFPRAILAVLAGMIVAVTVVSAVDIAAGLLHPIPVGFDPADSAQLRAHAESAPMTALVVVLAGWLIAPFVGGVIASRVAASHPARFAWLIAGIFLLATITNVALIPHPIWMTVAALIGIPAAGWLAARSAPDDPNRKT